MNQPEIAIVSQHHPAIHNPLLEGVAAYCRKYSPWQFSLLHIPRTNAANWSAARFSEIDGILALDIYPELQNLILQTGKAAVAVNTGGSPCSLPTVTYDEREIGRMAADHLADLGLKRLAFAGFDRFDFSRQREAGFVETARRRGLKALALRLALGLGNPAQYAGPQIKRKLRAWIKRLQPPVGVFCANDALGIFVSQLCVDAGLNLPADVLLLGVDNDAWLCESAPIPMSSVDRNSEQAGYKAAEMLANLLGGKKLTQPIVRIPPARIVTRRSTELLDPEHPEFTQAIQFIRDHACEGITMYDLLRAIPVSRSSLHRMFKKFLGYPPGEEIQRHRLEKAKRMLTETDIALSDVATHCGFGWPNSLCRAFRARYQITPAAFRRQARTSGMRSASSAV